MDTLINPLIINSGVWGLVHDDLVGAPMSLIKLRSYFFHLLSAFVIVGAPMFASVVRYMKSNLMDTLPAQYLQTARAKGVREGTSFRSTHCATRSIRWSACSASCCRR